MKTEYCILFKGGPAYHNGKYLGIIPDTYELVTSLVHRNELLKIGGIDVSHDKEAWKEADKQNYGVFSDPYAD